MATKTKTFDCVEMKHRAQRELQAEYERRKDEFPSLVAFLNAKARSARARAGGRPRIRKP